MFNIGDKVQWDTVKGPKTGVIERIDQRGILIRLPNQKCIIANETSLKAVWQNT